VLNFTSASVEILRSILGRAVKVLVLFAPSLGSALVPCAKADQFVTIAGQFVLVRLTILAAASRFCQEYSKRELLWRPETITIA
jgi:hypothetical protein